MRTERLYYTDSYLRAFDARVIETRPLGDRTGIVLDRSAFYPTSGGQPHDLGTLGGVAVVDVIDEDEAVVHLVMQPVAGVVRGEIDWSRRYDHMQQHTGQHILSQAALQTLDARTLAVHFGAQVCTLDLDLATLTTEDAARVEDLANAVVFEDRPVMTRAVDEAALPDLGLRRPTKKRGLIRIVEVEGFDRSACGGTHVRRTGEVGPIKIRGSERYKSGVRVEFLCGWRAVHDYRWKSRLVADLAASFTVRDREVGDAVARLSAEAKDRERLLTDLRDRLLEREARDYLAAAQGHPRIIAALLDRSAEEASVLAGKIIAAASAVVIFGAAGGRIILARSGSVGLDARTLLRRIVEAHGGRGGGRAEFAQGAVPPEALRAAVEAARDAAHRHLDPAGS